MWGAALALDHDPLHRHRDREACEGPRAVQQQSQVPTSLAQGLPSTHSLPAEEPADVTNLQTPAGPPSRETWFQSSCEPQGPPPAGLGAASASCSAQGCPLTHRLATVPPGSGQCRPREPSSWENMAWERTVQERRMRSALVQGTDAREMGGVYAGTATPHANSPPTARPLQRQT